MGITVLIPARLGSTRFPNKVLKADTGRPLIAHVWEAAMSADDVDQVVIAAEDSSIVKTAEGFGAEAVLTGEHPNGTSRLAEAARLLGLTDSTVIVNVQGDEPELDPGLIPAAASMVGPFDAGTVASPIADPAQFTDPNVVKAIVAPDGRALYFTRAPAPHDRDATGALGLRHVGIYAYSAGFLAEYAALPATPLEEREKLEQLRILEHGRSIGVAIRESSHAGIDTPEQYAAFVARYRGT